MRLSVESASSHVEYFQNAEADFSAFTTVWFSDSMMSFQLMIPNVSTGAMRLTQGKLTASILAIYFLIVHDLEQWQLVVRLDVRPKI